MPGFAGTIKAHGVTDAEACDGYREEEVRGWLLTCWSGELGSGAGPTEEFNAEDYRGPWIKEIPI
jgi:hypothetical protein